MLAREHAHRRATGKKVLDHLPRHVARVGRHAPRREAVVGGEHEQLRLAQHGLLGALQQADLQGQRFDAAERALRLGLGVEQGLQALRQRS